ncbi:hypothetical protein [Achromobacter spanius]|uniref:hypothetical protein n=1 Tax=Achromobacter spanius TaxID=217203 RepID=UPI003F68FE19
MIQANINRFHLFAGAGDGAAGKQGALVEIPGAHGDSFQVSASPAPVRPVVTALAVHGREGA